MKKFKVILAISFILVVFGSVFMAFGSEGGATAGGDSISGQSGMTLGVLGKFLGAGLAIAGATVGAGVAIGRIGSAAVGAVTEKPETFVTSLIFIALAESVALWGFIVALMILGSN